MNEVELAEKLSDHKHRIGSLEHRMEKAENLIEEIRSMSSSIQLLAQEVQKQVEQPENRNYHSHRYRNYICSDDCNFINYLRRIRR